MRASHSEAVHQKQSSASCYEARADVSKFPFLLEFFAWGERTGSCIISPSVRP